MRLNFSGGIAILKSFRLHRNGYTNIVCLPGLLVGFSMIGCHSKQKLFNKIDSGISGIHFNNVITENDSINPIDKEFLYNGGGVAAGDFNNDGLQDLYFTAGMVSNKLYLNKGGFAFKDVTETAGVGGKGRWCDGASVVDINNDGLLDIYVCVTIKTNPAERTNLLYINQGLNKDHVPIFKEMAAEYGLADTSYSVQAAFFDYDNDGDLDMYLLTTKMAQRDATQFGSDVINKDSSDVDRYINPTNNTTTNFVKGITQSTEYRSINRNGVCPPDTSSIAAVSFVPFAYPEASVSPADTTICFGTDALLNVNIGIGSGYTWSPFSLGGGNINNTPFSFVSQVFPAGTTDYILQVYNEGCPNPLLDTFHVAVLPKVVVDAGRDTSVVIGEPLQFNASSGDENPDAFFWSPATGLSDPSIANPVGTYNINDNVIKYTVKATTPFGCTGEGFITVKVFKTKPDIFVPNAFTPGLSTNTVFRPIPVGISSLHYFRIFNRQGQQVYNTTAIGNGWDGRLNGVPQASGGYVWMVEGTDYHGDIVTKKGIMVLIR